MDYYLTMKVLFLDVDGVLNTDKSYGHMWPLDPEKIAYLHRIKEATGCDIVLSSAWRASPEGVAEVNKALAPHRIYDTTPLIGPTRGDEIAAWLEAEKNSRDPSMDPITVWAMLDDTPDFHDSQYPHWFKTSFNTGLTQEITEQVIAFLNHE